MAAPGRTERSKLPEKRVRHKTIQTESATQTTRGPTSSDQTKLGDIGHGGQHASTLRQQKKTTSAKT
eukprot:10969048-Lingulodinium_polyedra.AAC.1